MLVYRLMSKKELDLFVSKDMNSIGKPFPKGKLSNNHRYKKGIKYVHMFRNLKDINFVRFERDSEFEYVATFDIPMITLMISCGKGLYSGVKNGEFKQKYVKEYAINSERIKPEYLIEYAKIDEFKQNDNVISIILNSGVELKSDKDFLYKIL